MMNTKTMRKAARDLVPGDVLFVEQDKSRLIVLHVRSMECRRIELTLATLGEFEAARAANAVVNHDPNAQFMVELPAGLTPVQAAADKLLELCLEYFTNDSEKRHAAAYAELRALLDELDPPKPVTLEEAVAELRHLTAAAKDKMYVYTLDHAIARAESLISRVPD